MRNFTSVLFIGIYSIFLFSLQMLHASAAGTVSGFEIIAPTTVKVNEAFDITVRAIDKDKKTVTTYNGSIMFISETLGDIVPSPGKSISFTKEDGGQKKFSKGVTFRSAGKQKIIVADVEQSADVLSEVSIIVEPADVVPAPPSTETVTVVTPANNTQITEDMVVVSGKTKKNSKVVILLNGQDRGTTVSDDSGLFTKTLSGISQEKNILQVQLLDGTNAVISKSEDIIFEKVVKTQGFYNIVISPATSMEASSQAQVLIEGDPDMQGVSIMIDNAAITLTEKDPGKYTANFVAPANAGTYPIDVSMKSLTAQAIEKKAVTSIIVTPKAIDAPKVASKFSALKAVTKGKRVTFEFSLENAPADLDKFKIAYGENADSLSQEVITFSSGRIQGTGGIYTWYIDNLEPKNYTFKIFGLKSDGSLIDGLISDPVIANVSIQSCTIGNASDIVVTTEGSQSILTWRALTGALSYNVYKISAAGDHVLVQNVTDPRFVVHHSHGAVTYNDFVVKALCEENKESVDMIRVSRVQTGPGALAFIVVLSGILGILLLRKRSIT